MRYVLLIVLSISFGFLKAQKPDSIKYANGYLYFHEYGKGEPIILLTGGPGSSYLQLEDVASKLGGKYRAILLEQRGTGRSIPTPFDSSTVNLDATLNDITVVLNHLNIKKATLLGHSWGGMVAMLYTLTFPENVSSLLLIDSGPLKPEEHLTKAYMDSREMNLGDCERAKRDTLSKKAKAGTATIEEAEALKKISYLSIVYNRNDFENIYKKITNGGNNAKTSGLLFSDWFRKAESLQNKLPQFKQPIIIIAGRQDPGGFMSYEIKLQVPKAKLYWIDKAGHFPMFDQPESFYATLFKALKER